MCPAAVWSSKTGSGTQSCLYLPPAGLEVCTVTSGQVPFSIMMEIVDIWCLVQ